MVMLLKKRNAIWGVTPWDKIHLERRHDFVGSQTGFCEVKNLLDRPLVSWNFSIQ